MEMKRESIRRMVLAGLFMALILMLGMTPLGLIPLGFVNVTILCVPVIIGTIVMGLRFGLLLGACFGLASTLSAFGLSLTPPSALASALVAQNPLLAIVMCFAPRLMVPVTTHFVYRLAARGADRSHTALPLAAVAGSLTNTVLYLGLMLFFYWLVNLNFAKVIAVIGGTGLIAGGSEAVVAAILVSSITAALWKIR